MLKGPFPAQLSGKYFMLEILTTTPNETFTLPLNSSGSYNFTVNWGDGTPDSAITTYNDPDRIHTFTSAGTYIIAMKGTCTEWRWDLVSGDKPQLRKILDFTDMGFTTLNFSNCINLKSVASSMKNLTHLTTAHATFQNCPLLTSVPEGIFSGSPGITSFHSVFFYCTGLTSISENIFKYNINATNFYQALARCTSLTSIPANLFRYNTKVTTFSSTFYNCTSLTSIPTDLFKYNTKVTLFSSTFNSCSNLTSIPTDLFRYNILVTYFDTTFSGTNINTIPTDFFRYNIEAWNFGYLFSNCYNLASIPVDLFQYNTKATYFKSTLSNCNKLHITPNIFWADGNRDTRFYNQSIDFTTCFRRGGFTGIQGTAPDLWNCDFGSGTPIKTDCFDGAGNSTTSLTNYTDIPAEWK